jgi:hypothetical protein
MMFDMNIQVTVRVVACRSVVAVALSIPLCTDHTVAIIHKRRTNACNKD